MYLAHVKDKTGKTRFVIRESVKGQDGLYRSRDLFDLGEDPEIFIKYVGPKGFYIDPDLEDEVRSKATYFDYRELEELFWPFLDPEIKITIENFSHGRSSPKGRYRRGIKGQKIDIHPFDRRRLLFLKFGQINIEPMWEHPFPFLELPLNKSRDEIEHAIGFMELELRPWEMRGYLYTIFNLPEHFKPRQSRFIPEVQDLNQMDSFFLEELCKLNNDPTYLDQGARETDHLGVHPYLRKYLIYYFDIFFHSKGAGYIGGRFRTEGTYREPSAIHPNEDEYLAILGITKDEFDSMDEQELTRTFRKKALKLHPDKGGDHENFIRLKEAYTFLMRRKNW
ncbi:heat shock protein DnaJ domain protein [Dissulfuribacter thermophilus]|uniref:Heat shock protein DnaJ domain protein n=1 Tax=Dissulfuribacter thermophilus TaxID=1156395 RepID=A0A1B9F8H8_9BACT|nr:J domain-containing protein [Dissulfuribacter thermophilus]OCC16115.1 heat shock protein DnaJ domain protein [Dissulfuribacter thermophilus]